MTDHTDTTEAESTEDVQQAHAPDDVDDTAAPNDDNEETFTRDYVEGLRQENGKYRQRAVRADELAQRLHTELVRSTGRLADPGDLPFDEEHLADPDKLSAAIDDLLLRKPHFASRRPIGDIGQGPSPTAATVDLAAILRQGAE